MIRKKDLLMMHYAHHIAEIFSDDQNTKVGAVIVNKYGVVSESANCLPIGIDKSDVNKVTGENKYFNIEHAERGAILKCAKFGFPTNNTTMYVTHFPYHDCARAIILSGIKRLVCNKEPDFTHKKWGESWKFANELFNESKIKVEFINKTKFELIEINYNYAKY